MSRHVIFSAHRKQYGSAAVELALCMTLILVPLLFWIMLLGKFFWYYTATQKAVHNAALYMASAPIVEIRSGGAGTLALNIIAKETSDFDSTTTIVPSVLCAYKFGNTNIIVWTPCSGTTTPIAVQAAIELTIESPFFHLKSTTPVADNSVGLLAFSQIAYVGI